MKKFIPVIVFVFPFLAVVVLLSHLWKEKDVVPTPQTVATSTLSLREVKNSTFVIDGESFTLVRGTVSKDSAPGSASKDTVSLFGEPVYGDLNGDGNTKDAAVLLVRNSGGSGTFYYAALAIASGTTYSTTNALLLGDRIAPQTVEISEGRALYNYAERKNGEPMTASPQVGKTLYIMYDTKTHTIGELVKNFEGEANPASMTLFMKKWEWVKTTMNDGKVVTPKKQGVFALTFTKDGRVAVATDCNMMSGSYVAKDKKITFGLFMSTKMFCEASQENDFASALGEVAGYMFTSKGELILEIKMDSGVMVFR